MRIYTEDDFFGGKLKLRQPQKGYRAGSDALLLAAALPKIEGKMLEVGAGVCTPSICYLSRVFEAGFTPKITAVELFDDITQLAEYNIKQNGFNAQIKLLNIDIFDSAASHEAAGLLPDSFDHIFSNPPFFDPTKNKTSSDDYKALAHTISQGGLERWLVFMVRLLKNKSSLTIIYPMEQLYRVLKILENRVGDISIIPIFSKPNAPATRFLLQGKKGSRGPFKMLQSITLRNADGSVTKLADAIFRDGEAIDF